MAELTKQLLSRLQDWCSQQRGRQAEAARFIGVSDQGMWNLLNGKQEFTGEQALAIQLFLKKHRRH